MILGIDASNIRAGGGVTHLVELLSAANPSEHGFSKVIVWGAKTTLDKIDDRDWLKKVNDSLLDRSLPYRLFWQRFRLKKLAEQARCGLLFIPGGSDLSGFKPMITMSQNLLPFELLEIWRYGLSPSFLRFLLLRVTQSSSFRKAEGVIFLTKYARDAVLKITGPLKGRSMIIPHGINPQFLLPPRSQRLPTDFNNTNPCRVLYVSIIDVYKHQWHVAEALAQLRSTGVPVVLDLIGPVGKGMRRLQKTLKRVDPKGEFIFYKGMVPYSELHAFYAAADIGVFASTCETFGMILLEAMSAGLPIACSNCSSMPETLGDSGLYFDPVSSNDIARVLRNLIYSSELRARLAQAAFQRAQSHSWKQCAGDTFGFISGIAKSSL
jgi:glycosyltransferase involved in cell wall biosynthesis